jgi:Zn-dependent protease with chaperone function
MELKGYYLDGKTAERKDAVVWVEITGLAIDLPGGARLLWPYGEIRKNRDFSDPNQIRLEKGGPIPETLVVPREAFLIALKRIFPGTPRPFHDSASPSKRLAYTVFGGIGTVGIIAALYLWGIPFLSSWAASRVPVSWEESLGRSVVESLAPVPARCPDSKQGLFLQEIVDTLSASLPERSYKFQIIVLDESEVNAFAAPGGSIVIFHGLLEKVQTTEELAGILAHEMQHILHRHSTRMLLEHVSLGLLLGVIMGDANSAMKIGKEGAGLLGALHYTRQFEEQADAEGMRLMLAAGIDPRGMISFFEKIQKEDGKTTAIPAYFSTHPSPESRIEKLKILGGDFRNQTFRPLAPYDAKKIQAACKKKL